MSGSQPSAHFDSIVQAFREGLKELIRKGIDPKHKEAKERDIEQERRDNTFRFVAEEFIKRHLKGQRRARVSEREIRKELISRWGTKPVIEITRRDVVAMVDTLLDRGAKRQAHNILGHARTLFNWAINRGVYGLEQSPCDRLSPSKLIGPKNTRKRVLNDIELRAVAMAAQGLRYPYGPLVKLLMLTGQRKAEVGEASWKEFDLDKKLWTVPAERFKPETDHFVPLAQDAIALLNALPRLRGGDHLFSYSGGETAVNGFSKAKELLDEAIAKGSAPIEPWVFNDLRRTVRTRLSALRVPDAVAEMVVDHAQKGLARVYNQHQYIDEMREALDLWAAGLRDILEPPPKNVVKLQGKSGTLAR